MIFKTILASGFSFNSKPFHTLILRAPFFTTLLRLKPSPQFVLQHKTDFSLKAWLNLLSHISTGPTFKTTSKNRSPKSDKIILDLLKNQKGTQIADMGTSSGASILHLHSQLQPAATFHIFDKFNHLFVQPKFLHQNILNSDLQIVSIKFPGFLLHTWTPKSKKHHNLKNLIQLDFTDPATQKAGLRLKHFDIFKSKSQTKFHFIRIANVLNLSYFTKSQIQKALTNLHSSLKPKGHLILIQNLQSKESFLLLQKTKTGFKIIKNHHSKLALLDFTKLKIK